MLFNSLEFALFLPLVFLAYWYLFAKNLRAQNFFVLAASYFFYGWWDWRFLSLIAFSSLVDYFVGVNLGKEQDKKRRKMWLVASILVNLGFLGFFKYYNFFVQSFVDSFSLLGRDFDPFTLSIILPVGISFYTFQTLSYSIDVYKGKLEPTRDMLAFFAFVSFFPQLVAGPIERATNLLPQFYKERTFNYAKAVDGMRQILWGLFKKIVIADNCARYVNEIFGNYEAFSGSTLLLGAVLFAFQIYGDFSGYSDIAIGTARLFGFDLMRNFAFPYFSRDIAEFWRRWHISLSTWFRDYVYIPLGGSRGSMKLKIRNTFVVFLVSGFWHGANWTFLAWGAIHALLFLPLLLSNKNRTYLDNVAENRFLPSFKESGQMLLTFLLVTLAWVFFRSPSIAESYSYIERIILFSPGRMVSPYVVFPLAFIALLLGVEWLQRRRQHGLEITNIRWLKSSVIRYALYLGLSTLILVSMPNEAQDFIYFQF